MKRLLILLCVAGLLATIPLSHVAVAAKKKAKKKVPNVSICHLNSANDVVVLGTLVIAYGRVIEVSENAVAAHEAHGDMASPGFFDMSEEARDLIEENFGVSLPNANCGFVVP